MEAVLKKGVKDDESIFIRKVVVRMSCVKLFPHQIDALKAVEGKRRCAFYHDM